MLELPGGTITTYHSREDWLKARKLGLGGSDIGALLGVSRFSSPLQVFYEKTEDFSREVTERMEIGAAIEPWILDRWFFRGADPTPDEGIYDELCIIQSNEYPFLLHSPDAILHNAKMEPVAGVEIKNISSDYNWNPLPDGYMAQVQHGMLCSGLDRWIVVALVGGQKLITREIEVDRTMHAQIIREAEKFWTSHVLANVPPEPDGSESASDVLNRRWGASQDESVEIDEWLITNLRAAEREVKAAEAYRAKTQQQIKSKMGDKEVAVTPDGERFATWKVSTRTSIDTRRLRENDPELAKKYEKTSPTRVFRPNL